jgi:hypothetical protein
MPSRLCKVTFFTDKEYFWIAHYIGHERIFSPKVCFPLNAENTGLTGLLILAILSWLTDL